MNIKSTEERLSGYQPLWENWFLDSLIYNGANSRVYKIKRNRDGEEEYAAMKAVTITLDNDLFISGDDSIKYLDDRCKNAKSEIKNMIKLQRSPYIVSYYDDVTKEIIDDTGVKCGYDILIRMEYLECFGARIRKKDMPVTTQDVINLAYDIGNALLDVHKNKMIHRDIKPDNIFIDEFGYYKLGDLGVTKSINALGYASTRTGTEPYAAPEVWRSESYTQAAYTYKADIYSFGLVLYQLMNNNFLPFMNDFTHNELEKSISMRMRGEKISPPANGSQEFKNIICRMCQFNPDDRFNNMSEFISALAQVGTRSEYTDQSDSLELSQGNPADQIPTVDANEGCAVYKQINENRPDPTIGIYIPESEGNFGTVSENDQDNDGDTEFIQPESSQTQPVNEEAAEPVHENVTESSQTDSVNEGTVKPENKEHMQHQSDENIISEEFCTHQKYSQPQKLFSDDDSFHTFPAQYAAVNQTNARHGKNKPVILSSDGVFRKEDYHKTRVKEGVLVVPQGYFSIAPFTLYQIERDLITQVEIPGSITSFKDNAFKNLTNLKTINISGDVMIIKSNLFSGCTSLETVILPLSTRKIEDFAFEGCKSLRSVDARGYITGIGKNAFAGCNNVVIKCKENSFMHKYCIKYNIRTEFVDGETGE